MSLLPYKNTPLKSSLNGKPQHVCSLTAGERVRVCAASLGAHRVRCVLVTRAKLALTVPNSEQTAGTAGTGQHLPDSATAPGQGNPPQGDQRSCPVSWGSNVGRVSAET